MHNSTFSCLCTLMILTVPFHHSPLLRIEIQKRQLLKKFLSPPYRTKQGGKTKHLLKNSHFLQKVGAGFLLWAAFFLTPLSHKIGVKTEVLFENFSKIFWENKKPGTKGYHITSRWSASLCGKLLRPAIWWFHITSLGSNVPRLLGDDKILHTKVPGFIQLW